MSSDQVVCIRNFPPLNRGRIGDRPVKGEIYTIRAVHVKGTSYLFEEIAAFNPMRNMCDVGYKVRYFRPIIDPDAIEIFREIDRKIFGKQKNKEKEDA